MPGGARGDVAVIRAGALGDVLLGLPALGALRRRFPDSRIVLVAPLPQARLARAGGYVDEILDFDDPAVAGIIAGSATHLPHALRGASRAIVWLRSWQVPRHTLVRLGIERVLGGVPIPPRGVRIHASDWLIRSMEPLGIAAGTPMRPAAALAVSPADRAAAAQVLQAAGVTGAHAVLHPGSGSRRKNWPVERWLEVVDALPTNLSVVVTAGPADEEVIASLQAIWPRSRGAPVVLSSLTLEALAGVLAGSALYLGNDSGVTHLAAAAGAPGVAVFGVTDPAVWAPRGPRVAVLGGAPASGTDGIFAAEARWPAVEEVVQTAMAMLRGR